MCASSCSRRTAGDAKTDAAWAPAGVHQQERRADSSARRGAAGSASCVADLSGGGEARASAGQLRQQDVCCEGEKAFSSFFNELTMEV